MMLESDEETLSAEEKESVKTDGHSQKVEVSHNYDDMTMDKQVQMLEKLSKASNPADHKDDIRGIRESFLRKYEDIKEEKKRVFLEEGNDEIDFSFYLPVKKEFDALHSDYKRRLKFYYDGLQKELEENYKKRLEVIEEIKRLVTRQEYIHTTYKDFIELQKRWRSIGHIPKVHLEDTWNSYHYHVDVFYDFLDINREFRDRDFKLNLEKKEKLISHAEELVNEPDIIKAIRELKLLHKTWREEIGPVSKEHREAVWKRFTDASDVIRERHNEINRQLQVVHEDNLSKKTDLLDKMEDLVKTPADSHNQWQKNIKEINTLKEEFFNIGQVPKDRVSGVWKCFRRINGDFNKSKKKFYDEQKEIFQKNIDAKNQLIERVKSLLGAEDTDSAAEQVKQLQKDWKTIGRVPYKLSEKMWMEFRCVCDEFFESSHKKRDLVRAQGLEKNLSAKKSLIGELTDYKPSEKRSIVDFIRDIMSRWSAIGRVAPEEKGVEGNFTDIVEKTLKSAGVTPQDMAYISYDAKLMKLSLSELERENSDIRKIISKLYSDKDRIETNMSFFNVDEDNPIIADTKSGLEKMKKEIHILERKKKMLNRALKERRTSKN